MSLSHKSNIKGTTDTHTHTHDRKNMYRFAQACLFVPVPACVWVQSGPPVESIGIYKCIQNKSLVRLSRVCMCRMTCVNCADALHVACDIPIRCLSGVRIATHMHTHRFSFTTNLRSFFSLFGIVFCVNAVHILCVYIFQTRVSLSFSAATTIQ